MRSSDLLDLLEERAEAGFTSGEFSDLVVRNRARKSVHLVFAKNQRSESSSLHEILGSGDMTNCLFDLLEERTKAGVTLSELLEAGVLEGATEKFGLVLS